MSTARKGTGFFSFDNLNWKTITLVAVMAVLVASISTFFFLLITIYRPKSGQVTPSVYSNLPSMPASGLQVLKNRTNILVLGVDERDWDAGRSDTMILVSVPSDGSAISLISIPRDTMVWLPESQTYDKISHLYNYRGPEFSVNAVERLLDLPIKGYVVVNLDGFIGLVDELGGVTIDVEEYLDYDDPYQDLYIDIPPGVQRLNGEKAMHFVRFRNNAEADIGRIHRQQQFLQALLDEFMAKKFDVTKIPGLITKGVSMVTTNIQLGDLTALVGSGIKSADKEMGRLTLSGDGLYYQGIAYFVLHYEDTLTMIADALFPENERQAYVDEHLNEPWVREYEWLRASLYAEALLQWERNATWHNPLPEEGNYIPGETNITDSAHPDRPLIGEEPFGDDTTDDPEEEEGTPASTWMTPNSPTDADPEEGESEDTGEGEDETGAKVNDDPTPGNAEETGDISTEDPEATGDSAPDPEAAGENVPESKEDDEEVIEEIIAVVPQTGP